jgi:uncharacterized protein YuzE
MNFEPYAVYRSGADAVYVYLSDAESARTRQLDSRRMIDYDSTGHAVGVELLGASTSVDLNGVPERETVERLLKGLQPAFRGVVDANSGVRLRRPRSKSARRRRELRRFWENLESWIWMQPRFCNHEAEYATYTEVPDDSPYWSRKRSEARLGMNDRVSPPSLLLLFGPPAVGKTTVGQELERLTGFRLLHNHRTIDLISQYFPWSDD